VHAPDDELTTFDVSFFLVQPGYFFLENIPRYAGSEKDLKGEPLGIAEAGLLYRPDVFAVVNQQRQSTGQAAMTN